MMAALLVPQVLFHHRSDVQRGGLEDEAVGIGLDLDPVNIALIGFTHQLR